jgi:serine/threonine protein kinase, bacterial
VYFATGTRLFRLAAGGAPQVVAGGLNGPHGLAVAAGGAVLVADTSNDRVLRVDPGSGAASTLIATGRPRGIDVASDGTIYLVEAGTKRVGRYSAAGARLGDLGPVFVDPFDVVAGPGGSAYVVETAAAGRIVRVAADGRVSPVP